MKKKFTLILFTILLLSSVNSISQVNRANSRKSVAYQANFQRVFAGITSQAFEIRAGYLWAWGQNTNGQLGDGTTITRTSPVQIGTDDKWVSVGGGGGYSAGIKSDGTLWEWGSRYGMTSSLVPVRTYIDNNWASISTMGNYSIALKTDGSLWSWGSNYFAMGHSLGQVGAPYQVGTAKWTKVSAIGNHVLGIRADGTLWAWGTNDYGQLGDGTTVNRPTPVQIGTDNKWLELGGTTNNSYALKSDGTLWAWGLNTFGQLGDGTTTNKLSPVQVGTDNDWVSITYGARALKSDGSLWAWGTGFLGNGVQTTTPIQLTPLKIGTDTWVSISLAAGGTTFGVKTDGSMWAWGSNASGQVGNGTTISQASPVQINSAPNTWLTVSAGATYSVAVKSNGTLWAWGQNNVGQLGDGTTTNRTVQTQIGTDTKWVNVVAGQDHSLGLKGNGSLWGWGNNNYRQLGDGTAVNKTSPVQIGTGNNWVSIAAGAEHSIGLKSDGTLWTWGHNNYGQLGDGSTTDQAAPTQVGTDNNWVSVAAGNFYSVALRTDGTLWAWGQNANGQLGDGTNTDKSSPVQIGTATWMSIVANSYHSMGIRSDGTMWCWGDNGYGQLGDGSTIDRNSPVKLGTDTWVSLSAGFFNSHAIRYDGRLYGWGKNTLGEVGDNSIINRSVPVIIGTAYWVKMTAGNGHSLGLKASRREICGTGYNAFGQVGYFGTTTNFISFICAGLPLACNVTATATATTNVDCFESPTGTATILLSGTGSGAPGTFTVDAGASQPYTTNPFTITGLSKGNHTIVVTVSGVPCTSNALAITIGSDKITGTATTTGASCYGNNDGTATVTLAGISALSPGTYTVGTGTPIPFTTNPFIVTGLTRGSKSITAIVTATGCSTVVSATIPSPPQNTGTATTTGVTCLGATNGTATITISGTGASAPGTYTLDNGTPQPYATNPFTITGLTPGSHSVSTYATAGSCFGVTNFVIASSPTQVFLSIVPTAVSCYGVNNDGSILVTLSGSGASSSGTYKVTVNANILASGSFSTNPFTVTGLAGVNYNLTVTTDLNNCISASTAFSIPSPPRLVCTYSTTPASCAGVSDATVTVTAPAGYVLPIRYSLYGGSSPNVGGTAATNPFTVTGLNGHPYSVVTYSATGCETLGTAFIGTNAVTGTGTTTPVSCVGGSDGTATITLTGTGTLVPGTYTVDGGAAQPYTTNPFTITGLTSGNHIIKATLIAAACSTPNITVFVGSNPAVTTSFTATTPTCYNGDDGTATITVSGSAGGAPGTYTLDGSSPIPYTTNPFLITGLTSGYHYVVVTVAAGPCTSASLRVEVPYPTPYGSSVTTTPSHCYQFFGDGTATITLTNLPANASGTYRVEGSAQIYPFTTNPFTVTGLRGGPQNVYVTLAGTSCLVIVPFTVPYETLTASATVTPLTCTGANDGTATITISGVSAPTPGYYQLVYNGPQIPYTTNPFTITGLTPGNHEFGIYATTYNCNGYIVDVTIGSPAINASLSVTPVSCAGNSDGTATINLTGLLASNSGTYTVDGGAAQPFTTNPFTVTGLAAGSRNIGASVTGGGCVSNIMANIGTALFTGLGITTAVSCTGASNGTASVLLSGEGVLFPGTYTVDAGPAQPYSSNPFMINNLAAGDHVVVANTSGTSCTSTDILINVATASIITGTGTTTPSSCIGNNGTATITLSGSGSLTPGTFTVDGGPAQPYTTIPFTITTLTAGTHTVIATVTANGCSSAAILVTVAGSGFTGSGTTTAADCFLNNNGTATITLTGGSLSAPGTYTVDGSAPQSYSTNPFSVTGLSGGSHTIVATVSAGACVSVPVIVNVPYGAFTGTGTTTPVSCAGNTDGTATITLAGGSLAAPGTYTVDGGIAQSYATNPFTITGLGAGNHTIIATVSGGLCISAPIEVSIASASFTAAYIRNNVSACNGVNDGSIMVTVTGSGAPFTYSWTGSNGYTAGNVSTVSNLPVGYYNVTITNAGGCGVVVINNIHIQFAFLVYITSSGTVAGSCGNNTGTISLYGNNGVLPYSYSLDGITYQSSNTFINLAAGNYTGYVKDAAGCVSQKPVAVGSAAPITVTTFSRGSSSCTNDGSIEVYRSGGVPPYSYSLDNIIYVPGNVFTNLAGGIYTAYVKDSKGCVASQLVSVSQAPELSVTVSKINTSTCINNGGIQARVTGGVPPYIYSINGTTFQTSNGFGGLGTGNYTLTVKDFKGCTGTLNFTIEPNPITVTVYPRHATNCVNNGKIEVYRSGGFAPYSYSLDGITYQFSSVFTNLPAGIYTAYVKDAANCVATRPGIVINQQGTGCRPFANNNVDVKSIFNVNVFPNPSSTSYALTVESNSTEKVSINITDIIGRKIYHSKVNTLKYFKFGDDLMPGVYILEVIQGVNKKSLKLIKD